MNSSPPPSLRARQLAATRDLILDTALQMLGEEPIDRFSHEAVATRAGMSARTVYRHFPTRADLLLALWQRLRDTTETRFPLTEEELLPFVHTQFRHFEEHEALVRASITTSANAEVMAHGWSEGRAAFRKSLAAITHDLSPVHARRLVALCVAIYSAPFWQMLRDRGQLSNEEAADAAAWALDMILTAARTSSHELMAQEPSVKEEHHDHNGRNGDRTERRADRSG